MDVTVALRLVKWYKMDTLKGNLDCAVAAVYDLLLIRGIQEMKVADEGYILNTETASGPLKVCTGLSLRPIASGSILATFRVGSAKDSADGNVFVAESLDRGETWEVICQGFRSSFQGVRGEIRASHIAQPKPGKLVAFMTWFERPEPGSKLYDAKTDRLLKSRLLAAQSEDGGRSWDDYREIDTSPFTGCAQCGPILQLPSKLLIPFETYERPEGVPQSIQTARCLPTADGRLFDPIVTVAKDSDQKVFYWDERLAYSPNHQRPVALFWTYDRAAQKDMPIHIAWSSPDGQTWEPPRSTGVRGQIALPLPLPDGRLLAFYVHRHPLGSMRLILSNDAGRTWDLDGELVVYENMGSGQRGMAGESDFAKYWEDMSTWTFGHPAGVVLDKSSVLLAYYAGKSKECLSARWARVEI